MSDLDLNDSLLGSAARLLLDAAAVLRATRSLPMLHAETYTDAADVIASFLRTVDLASEAVSDAAGAAASSAAELMHASDEIDAEISRALGPGFVK